MTNDNKAPFGALAALRGVLVLAGAFIAFTGVNIAFGGITTLGWQGQSAFLAVTNEHAYLVQDSHVRFLGGLWIGVGAVFVLAAMDLGRFRGALVAACALIFLGGLARFSQMNAEITLGPDVLGSLASELVGIPFLYFWLTRSLPTSTMKA